MAVRVTYSLSACSSTMETETQTPKGPDDPLSSLNAAIDTLDLAKDRATAKPIKDALDSASVLLTTIRVRFLPAHIGRLLTGIRRIRRAMQQIASD